MVKQKPLDIAQDTRKYRSETYTSDKCISFSTVTIKSTTHMEMFFDLPFILSNSNKRGICARNKREVH